MNDNRPTIPIKEAWRRFYDARWEIQKHKLQDVNALELPSSARVSHGDGSVYVFDAPESVSVALQKLRFDKEGNNYIYRVEG
ncbi:MAG: hypothetical protein F4118_08385 [Acidimicrobiaceae bacterium]|nr:hypothetical protein [Candidatus Poribacteria bacterium]MYI36435.1 hypothetical protein [Acidimicrobiaceae bacterium]